MTPLHHARNLGPVSAQALVAAGVRSLEELREIGWREAWDRLASRYPSYAHLNMGRALAGAILDCDWRDIAPAELDELRSFQSRRHDCWSIAPRRIRSAMGKTVAVK